MLPRPSLPSSLPLSLLPSLPLRSGSVVGSTVTFDLAENSTLPAGTASNISTYQVFLQVGMRQLVVV